MKKILWVLSLILIVGCTATDENGFYLEGSNAGINRKTRTMYDVNGYNKEGYDTKGYNIEGYNRNGFNEKGIHKEGDAYYKPRFYEKAWFEQNKYRWGNDILYKNSYGIKEYKRENVKIKVKEIIDDDSFKKYSDPEKIMKRDLDIRKQLQFIYKNKKSYETYSDLINNNMDKLEKIKEELDTVLTFKFNKNKMNLDYNPNTESIRIYPYDLFDARKIKGKKYVGSNAFGATADVTILDVRGAVSTLQDDRYYDQKFCDIKFPKSEMAKNNYNLKNIEAEFVVIVSEISETSFSREATLDSPHGGTYMYSKIIYDILGVKLKYNGKIIHKESFMKE